MNHEEFNRLADIFQREIRATEDRLGERLTELSIEGRKCGELIAEHLVDMSQRQTAYKMEQAAVRSDLSRLDQRQFELEKQLRSRSVTDSSQDLERDATIGLMKVEVDELKGQIIKMQGTPQRDSSAPTTLAAIGEAQQRAARSRWLPIALGVATAIGTMVNVLLHK